MNAAVTSKEEILKTSRELIRQQGWSSVSIRSVAAACGVSVGSIYNYFDSKAALLSETVGSVIFNMGDSRVLTLLKNGGVFLLMVPLMRSAVCTLISLP